jgi:hypothetical protein
MNKELQKAFRLILKELKEKPCTSYSFGCYACAIERLYQDLKDYYEMNK